MIPDILVVTGGPAGAKSELMRAVAAEFSDQTQVAPELMTGLLQAFPDLGKVGLTDSQIWELQRIVFPGMKLAEEKHREFAEQRGARLVVCDRGLLDGAGYVRDGLNAFLKELSIDLEEVLDRYVAVIHMESLAISDPDEWLRIAKITNPYRYEQTAQQAVERDLAIQEAWKKHPNWTLIQGFPTLEKKLEAGLDAIRPFVETEHELKFRLGKMPDLPLVTKIEIEQGYVVVDPQSEVRIRLMNGVAYQGVKSESLGRSRRSRKQWEKIVPREVFDALWPATESRRVFKTRYQIHQGRYLLEIDVYHGAHEGLVILEVEATRAEYLDLFESPDWAKDAQDVTEDSRYSNRELAITQTYPDRN